MSLEEIKEEYAQDNLFNDWEDFENHGISDTDLDEIAERYAQQRVNEVLDKAADVALDAVEENESAIRSVSLNAIAEALKNIKESILKLKESN